MIWEKLRNRFLIDRPPTATWRFERQTNPPTFGWAQIVSDKKTQNEILIRQSYCEQVTRQDENKSYSDDIALIILTCKRWSTLERLIQSIKVRENSLPEDLKFTKVIVDNDSGEEIREKIRQSQFFDKYIFNTTNKGLLGATRDAFSEVDAKYLMFVEDDFVLESDFSFLKASLEIFNENKSVGFIRLKNQNNWWKPFRRISSLRKTLSGVPYRLWLPSADGEMNGWCSGSVMFRKCAYLTTGELPIAQNNSSRSQAGHQGHIYECIYGKQFNKKWLTAKLESSSPFFQPNDNEVCIGWGN